MSCRIPPSVSVHCWPAGEDAALRKRFAAGTLNQKSSLVSV